MYKQLKDDGFTLIEIIVSIAIGTVVLGLVLSIILTSFNTFGDASDTGMKKDQLNKIVDFVNDQVKNADEVVISETQPYSSNDATGWKYLYVNNNDVLYLGKNGQTAKRVFGIGFYNKKNGVEDDTTYKACKLSMKVKEYCVQFAAKNHYRIQLIYNYSKYDGTKSYSRKDTISLDNVQGTEKKYNGDIRDISDANYSVTKDLKNPSIGSATNYKLYWKSTVVDTSDQGGNSPNKTYTGTVLDKLKKKTSYLDRGYWEYKGSDGEVRNVKNQFFYGGTTGDTNQSWVSGSNTYRIGDFVYYKGYWWICYKDNSNGSTQENPPSIGSGPAKWQIMDENYHPASYYCRGDIVKYKLNDNKYHYLRSNYSTEDNPSPSYNAPYYQDQWNNNIDDVSDINASGHKLWTDLGTDVSGDEAGYDTTQSFDSYGTLKSQNKDYNLNDAYNVQSPKESPINDSSIPVLDDNYSGVKYLLDDEHTFTVDEETSSGLKIKSGNSVKDFNTTDYPVATPDNANNSYIQIEVPNSGNSNQNTTYFKLYKKIFEPDSSLSNAEKTPGTSLLSGWELISDSYSPASSYPANVKVRYISNTIADDHTNYGSDYIQMQGLKVRYTSHELYEYRDTIGIWGNSYVHQVGPYDIYYDASDYLGNKEMFYQCASIGDFYYNTPYQNEYKYGKVADLAESGYIIPKITKSKYYYTWNYWGSWTIDGFLYIDENVYYKVIRTMIYNEKTDYSKQNFMMNILWKRVST